ncbi:MAG: AGE family epimerase/isomerase [Spirochaetia bacterium]
MNAVVREIREWARTSLLEDTLPYWYSRSFGESGFFHPQLDRQWVKREPGTATLVSQTRLLYTMSAAFRYSGDPKYRQAVETGAEFLCRVFRDREYPGWYWSSDSRGAVISEEKSSYGHGFVIFGLAHAGKLLEREDYLDLALTTLREMKAFMRDSLGGYYTSLSREGKPLARNSGQRTQNPMMHLFEAHLALMECGLNTSEVRESAEEIARFLHKKHGHSFRDKSLPETYSPGWEPLEAGSGGRIEIGHQLEWAYLLWRGCRLGLDRRWSSLAGILLDHALIAGESPGGGVYTNERPDRTGPVRKDFKWWPQCELIRVLFHAAFRQGRTDLAGRIAGHISFFRKNFQDPEYGGMYRLPVSSAGEENWDWKGTEWKIDYHAVSMWDEILREN